MKYFLHPSDQSSCFLQVSDLLAKDFVLFELLFEDKPESELIFLLCFWVLDFFGFKFSLTLWILIVLGLLLSSSKWTIVLVELLSISFSKSFKREPFFLGLFSTCLLSSDSSFDLDFSELLSSFLVLVVFFFLDPFFLFLIFLSLLISAVFIFNPAFVWCLIF